MNEVGLVEKDLKIIVDKNGENFEYIEKKAGEKADTITAYKLSDYPPER